MEHIKASIGGSKINLITLALLLFMAAFFVFSTSADHHPPLSVLKMPTEANHTSLNDDEGICCDDCGSCQGIYIPNCRCNDIVTECPSWCRYCSESLDGQYRCQDIKPNYCKKSCPKKPKNEYCCNSCRTCNPYNPSWCLCEDIMEECPSWCNVCVDFAYGKRCLDLKEDYCEQGCSSKHD